MHFLVLTCSSSSSHALQNGSLCRLFIIIIQTSVKISLYVLLWWHVPMQCLFVIATIMRNSLNFKITSLIFEMIYTANGKFIHFSSLKTQRNIFVVKTPGEAEFVERDEWALCSVRGVRQGVLFSPTFFIARSYCKGARVWMERERLAMESCRTVCLSYFAYSIECND